MTSQCNKYIYYNRVNDEIECVFFKLVLINVTETIADYKERSKLFNYSLSY